MAAAVWLVVFDMAGTTVDDIVDGKPVVMVAMQAAFLRFTGTPIADDSVTAIRGLEKKAALKGNGPKFTPKLTSNIPLITPTGAN